MNVPRYITHRDIGSPSRFTREELCHKNRHLDRCISKSVFRVMALAFVAGYPSRKLAMGMHPELDAIQEGSRALVWKNRQLHLVGFDHGEER